MKVVINAKYGGFGLSDAAYEKFIEWGVPVRAYKEQQRDTVTGLYDQPNENEGEVIFDRELEPASTIRDAMRTLGGRYWETWLSRKRSHPMLVRVVEELGDEANGRCAKLRIVEIPDDAEWEIDEYDGHEHVAEKHRTWYAPT